MISPKGRWRVTIVTTTYRKNSGGNTILLANSCHPQHTFWAMIRSKRNCSLESNHKNETAGIYDRLKQRNYSDSTLKKAIEKVKQIPRKKLLDANKKKHYVVLSSSVVFYTPFSVEFRHIANIIKNYALMYDYNTKSATKRYMATMYR